MSKLDNIIIKCANKVLDGKQETLGDYIDPTKEEIKALILELISEDEPRDMEKSIKGQPNVRRIERNNVRRQLRQKVSEL